jgi:hypothetical protein
MGERLKARGILLIVVICFITVSCRPLSTPYHFHLHLFFGIRDIRDAILLTLPVIRYPWGALNQGESRRYELGTNC